MTNGSNVDLAVTASFTGSSGYSVNGSIDVEETDSYSTYSTTDTGVQHTMLRSLYGTSDDQAYFTDKLAITGSPRDDVGNLISTDSKIGEINVTIARTGTAITQSYYTRRVSAA